MWTWLVVPLVAGPMPHSPTAADQYEEAPMRSPNDSNDVRAASPSHVIVTMTGAVSVGPPLAES